MKMQNVEWECKACLAIGRFRDTEFAFQYGAPNIRYLVMQEHLRVRDSCAMEYGAEYLEYDISEPYELNLTGESDATKENENEEGGPESHREGNQPPVEEAGIQPEAGNRGSAE